MSRAILIVLVACLALVASERIRYDNYRVYKVTPKTVGALLTLKRIEGASDSLIFLDDIHNIGQDINVVVSPHKVVDFMQYLAGDRFNYKLVDSDAQRTLDSLEGVSPLAARDDEFHWRDYHTLEKINDWLKSLAAKYPQQVTLVDAGDSYEGRDILCVKISYKTGNRGIIIEGGIHAREWISPATVTYIINELLTSKYEKVRDVAENNDWHICPSVNPDGYEFTHTGNRLWRKTRSKSPDGCIGVDANRNWGFHWKEIGASSAPCSDTYAGPSAFSEIETKTFSEFITKIKDNVDVYLSFHSYGQLVLYPYGHTNEPAPNADELEQIKNAAIRGFAHLYGTNYKGGNVYDAIYPAAGSSIDHAYSLGIKTSFTCELRPPRSNEWFGFVLPANQIIATGEETMVALVNIVQEAKSFGYFKRA